MLVRIKTKQSSRARLIKQIKEAKNFDELKGAMLQILSTPTPLNNATQGDKRGRI